jgi:hypothetical protein
MADGLQEEEMQYTLERTQYAVSRLGVHPPIPGVDKRHQKNVAYPFLDYDDLRDTDESPPSMSLFLLCKLL